MMTGRVTQGVNFNTGISMAEYNETPAGQTKGMTQGTVLPGSTTVSEAIDSVFPRNATMESMIFAAIAAEGASTLLRTGSGFRRAAIKTIGNLRRRGSEKAGRAADELEALLEDTELLDFYRAGLLES